MPREPSAPITIGMVTDEREKKETLDFIGAVIAKKYRCARPPCPELLFAARKNGSIVGTIALEFGDSDGVVPLRKFWRFDVANVPRQMDGKPLCQIGRWTATTPDAAMGLMYCCARYGIKNDKDLALCDLKGRVSELLREHYNIEVHPVPGATIRHDEIPESIVPYYLLPPLPLLYAVSLQQMANALEAKVLCLAAEGKIVI